MERLIMDRRFDLHPAYASPTPRWPGLMGFALVFTLPLAIIAVGRPLDAATGSIQTGQVDATVAASNRAAIEGVAVVQLPAGLVQTDRTVTPVSGQTIQGPAVLQNAYDANSRTLSCRGAGIGYIDWLKVTGQHTVQFSDPASSQNYTPGGMSYLFHVDGFQDGTGQLRTLQQVGSVGVGTARFNGVILDSRLTGAKWFAKSAVVGNTSAGMSSLLLMTPQTFAVGDWALLTEGPSIGNEGRDEWLRIAGVNPLRFAWPTQRAYSAAVLAAAQPVTGVTLKDLTIALPADGTAWTTQLNYFNNARLDNVTVKGTWCHVGSCYCTFLNCNFENCSLNSCHDCQFIGCTFGTCWLEECCFNLTFSGCTITKTFSGNTGIQRINLQGCHILAGQGNFIGLGPASGSIYDALTLDAGAYIGGDNVTVRNCRGSITLNAGSGVCMSSPGATISAGKWTVLP